MYIDVLNVYGFLYFSQQNSVGFSFMFDVLAKKCRLKYKGVKMFIGNVEYTEQ